MAMKVFTVRLARPVFQTSVVKVWARGRASAGRKALDLAASISDADWSPPQFDVRNYGVHVEDVAQDQGLGESPVDSGRDAAGNNGEGAASGSVKYILLVANMSGRAGFMVVQPWYSRRGKKYQVELCSDWVEPLDFIIENDGIDGRQPPAGNERARCSDLDAGDNVIEFPLCPMDREMRGSRS